MTTDKKPTVASTNAAILAQTEALEALTYQHGRTRRGTTRANWRAEQAHDRIDVSERAHSALVRDHMRLHHQVQDMSRISGWTWLVAAVLGLIAALLWSSYDFSQMLASGEMVKSAADIWWVALLFGAGVFAFALAVGSFFRPRHNHTEEV